MTEMQPTVVTIDGPAGSGKSTAARRLAERMGFQFLDTGAMYRAVAYLCLEAGVELHKEAAVAAVAESARIAWENDRLLADGRDLTEQIRTPEVTQAASEIAALPSVRSAMVSLQRQAAQGRRIVTEGRDQGTVVFPDARCKFYLIADIERRAERRQRQMHQQGYQVPLAEIIEQLRSRDARDSNRKAAPLRAAADATTVDTTHLSIDETAALLERQVYEILLGRD